MTWIRTIPAAEADEALRQAMEFSHSLYPVEYAEPTSPSEAGGADIVASHSLIPEALRHAFATFGALLSPELPLTRRQHEMITTVVSAANRCKYGLDSHAEFLRRVTLDEALVAALREDFRAAPISAGDRVMLNFAVKLTKDATKITREDHEELLGVGFDDRGILQITLIAAWFNYINRVADALGVGRG